MSADAVQAAAEALGRDEVFRGCEFHGRAYEVDVCAYCAGIERALIREATIAVTIVEPIIRAQVAAENGARRYGPDQPNLGGVEVFTRWREFDIPEAISTILHDPDEDDEVLAVALACSDARAAVKRVDELCDAAESDDNVPFGTADVRAALWGEPTEYAGPIAGAS